MFYARVQYEYIVTFVQTWNTVLYRSVQSILYSAIHFVFSLILCYKQIQIILENAFGLGIGFP